MTRVATSLLITLLCACGGQQIGDDAGVDGGKVFDVASHFGECCLDTGGVPGLCADAGIQCRPTQYCGLRDHKFPDVDPEAETQCCGTGYPNVPEIMQLDLLCPPFPAGTSRDITNVAEELTPHWGECCYLDEGGVPGPCASPSTCNTALCAQCAPYQYCGKWQPPASPEHHCCGDRYLATVGYSPIDSACLPSGVDGGL